MASLNKEGSIWCTLCSKHFNSFIAFHNHKIHSPNHTCCEVCSQDFNTEEAAAQHHKLMHSNEQDLRCPGCHKKFVRLGALIGHIELTICKSLNLDIEATRKEKEATNAAIQSARSFKDFSRTGGTYTEEPHPLARTARHPPQLIPTPETATTATPSPSPSAVAADRISGYPPQPIDLPITYTHAPIAAGPKPVFVGNDLLGDFGTNDILSAPWGDEAEVLKRPVIRASPPAFDNRPPNVIDTQVVNQPGGNAWAKQQNLFPDAPPAISPPPEVATAISQNNVNPAPVPAPNPFDPNSPGFKAENFFIPVLNKYKCPYKKCGKSIEKRNAFVNHLQSPAHRDERLQCTSCLRYYDTATALTQHMESQGVRCKVRETNTYEAVVDQVTGGVALPFGKHDDDTVKYVVNEEVLRPAGRGGALAAANKAVATAKNENFNTFWAKNNPRW